MAIGTGHHDFVPQPQRLRGQAICQHLLAPQAAPAFPPCRTSDDMTRAIGLRSPEAAHGRPSGPASDLRLVDRSIIAQRETEKESASRGAGRKFPGARQLEADGLPVHRSLLVKGGARQNTQCYGRGLHASARGTRETGLRVSVRISEAGLACRSWLSARTARGRFTAGLFLLSKRPARRVARRERLLPGLIGDGRGFPLSAAAGLVRFRGHRAMPAGYKRRRPMRPRPVRTRAPRMCPGRGPGWRCSRRR